MRRAKIVKQTNGRWIAVIVENGPATSPRDAWIPLFFKSKPTHAAAVAWAIAALEEFYAPPLWDLFDGRR